jgi:cytidylate kinase
MDNPKIIITINRESGSGGGEIARLLGAKLGLKVYGRALLQRIAEQFDMTLENMDRVKAQKTSWWGDFCRFYRQFDTVSQSYGAGSVPPAATPLSLYYAESRLLRELAEQESCIIVGRAGFHIFRDHPNALHLLIMADRDARIARIAAKQHLSDKEAAKVVDSTDKARDNFVQTVAETSRYDARNYDFTLNVTGFSAESVAQFLADNILKKFPSLKTE